TLMATGLVLTLADPKLGDAGLAICVMGPVLAALVARSVLRRVSWLALVPLVVLGLTASLLGLPATAVAEPYLLATSAAAFVLAFAVVALSAHRINAAYEVHDKAQLNAYRHLIEHVQDAVLRFTPDGAVMVASRSSVSLLVCPRSQLAGSKLSDRLHVTDRPHFLTGVARAREGGRSRTMEVGVREEDPRGR